MTTSDDGPLCFPVLDLFRRMATAGGLVKQEKHHMMTLVESPKAGELSSDKGSPLNSNPQEDDQDEILFSKLEDDGELSGKGNEHADETIEDEMIDTSETSSSSSSASSSSSQNPIEASSAEAEASSELSQEVQATQQTPTTQEEEEQQPQEVKPKAASILRKTQNPPKPPSVFGLDVVMESGLEELEDEVTEVGGEDEVMGSQHAKQQGGGSSLNHHAAIHNASGIRWSEENDPNALNVTVHEVECIKDLTDMWWQGSDLVNIKQGVSEAIRFCKAYNRNHVELLEDIMRCDCLEDEDLMNDLLKDLLSTCDSTKTSESFLRGLEGHLSKHINKYRKRHAKKVLSVQEGLKDKTLEETWEVLREESLDKSQPLSAFARRMGQFDEMVVAKSQKARASLWGV
mmetsp:Transcript_14557/g.35189  ORF Transcript_14557/g.35189 Transcript_14557/m.35189 type:complete len:402 (+) Transcript_14557:139-1344(+)|eukprot:CAMPEP_0113634794 /NCGR_PEP_ID=MMETSP0017_2-20120614/18126_1 /TAXON_ID=2856 /ORGANISM="Cylindrotheca closterium" /LENGTH=401 /DNA_ID=CAMNT_0000545525 /DNA_START=139 /DNA_END=1344 /DNA_ORIENTATION=- /assembly_acc=CAM_ASM_000147